MVVRFFDYLFYRVYWWNCKIVKEKELPLFSTFMGVSVFHGINVSTVYFFLLYLIDDIQFNNKWIYSLLLCLILLFDYVFYFKSQRYKKIINVYFIDISKSNRLIKDIILIIYIIISIFLFLWILYTGNVNNR